VLDALIRSLDEVEAVDDGRTVSDEEWTAEIDRRLERYERGESVTRSWEEVDADLERRIQRIERQTTKS
jgi:putative addiction module component (TIGR02574 family)